MLDIHLSFGGVKMMILRRKTTMRWLEKILTWHNIWLLPPKFPIWTLMLHALGLVAGAMVKGLLLVSLLQATMVLC
jgi:hypothetical protein